MLSITGIGFRKFHQNSGDQNNTLNTQEWRALRLPLDTRRKPWQLHTVIPSWMSTKKRKSVQLGPIITSTSWKRGHCSDMFDFVFGLVRCLWPCRAYRHRCLWVIYWRRTRKQWHISSVNWIIKLWLMANVIRLFGSITIDFLIIHLRQLRLQWIFQHFFRVFDVIVTALLRI